MDPIRDPGRPAVDVASRAFDSPLGPIVATATAAGLAGLAYPDPGSPPPPDGRPGGPAGMVLDETERQLDEYWRGTRRTFELPIDWGSTDGFVRTVLEACMAVPYGTVTTYRDLAVRAGRPRAYRAAGNALAVNPLVLIVPCHRVLRSDGALGGYGGRVDRKEHLLAHEARAGRGEPAAPTARRQGGAVRAATGRPLPPLPSPDLHAATAGVPARRSRR